MQMERSSKFVNVRFVTAIIACLLFLTPFSAFSTQLTLEWNRNPNSVTPDYYTVYYGTVSRNYYHSIEVYEGTSCPLPDLEEGVTYYFSVTASAEGFGESVLSEEISHAVEYNYSPIADFAISEFLGNGPYSVHFTDLSQNGPTAWLWNFGDGGTSTEASPSHLYLHEANYTVSLTVANVAGYDELSIDTSIIPCPYGSIKIGESDYTESDIKAVYQDALDGDSIEIQAHHFSGDSAEGRRH